jgi:hypothetical protein
LSTTYLEIPQTERKMDSAQAARKGFPYRKRSQHDVQMQRMKRVRGKFAASQAGLGNCQE